MGCPKATVSMTKRHRTGDGSGHHRVRALSDHADEGAMGTEPSVILQRALCPHLSMTTVTVRRNLTIYVSSRVFEISLYLSSISFLKRV